LSPCDTDRPNRQAVTQHRDHDLRSETEVPRYRHRGRRIVWIHLTIGAMDHLAMENRSGDRGVVARGTRKRPLDDRKALGRKVVGGGQMNQGTVERKHGPKQSIAYAPTVFGYGVEDRLGIGGKP